MKSLLGREASNPLPYILPLLVYTLAAVSKPAQYDWPELLIRYALQVAVTAAAIAWAWPVIRLLSWKVPLMTWPVGVAGGLLWLVLAKTKPVWQLGEMLGYSEWSAQVARPGLDPNQAFLEHPVAYCVFLLIRGVGLVFVVALAEELFLRGFLLRYLASERWWEAGVGQVTKYGWLAAAVYGMITHPAELAAAASWFSLITWLAWRTNRFAACVAAHAIANTMLFVYVLLTGSWSLW